MSKPEHSPLPWYVDDDDCVCDANHIVVGDTGYGERQLPDARLIVTAVNSYYDNKAAIAELEDGLIDVAASLVAAVSLLERGGKKAAPSDKMFDQMLVDYKNSIKRARALIAKHKAVKP